MRLEIFVAILLFSTVALSEGSNTIPSLQAVADQALHYAHLEPQAMQHWEKNVRKAPLLPRLQLGFERQLRNGIDINLEDSVAVNSSGVTVGPTQSRQIQNADTDLNFEVKAVWYLDQLLFSKDHLDISQEARYLSLERARILAEVRKYYFQREKGAKILTLLERQKAPSLEREIKEIEVSEATAALDNLTGGWFSAQIQP